MAKLQSDELTLEVKFNSFENEWVNYDINFYWKDDIIINDDILKRDGKWWGKRSYGTFLADDYQKDNLINTIRKILETNKADYWEPLEPDVKIAIYPDEFFPFLKSHWALIDPVCGEEQIVYEEQYEKYPNRNDLFTIMIFIDSYNFKDCVAYSGEGISLHMVVRREDLEKFVTNLEIEYSSFAKVI